MNVCVITLCTHIQLRKRIYALAEKLEFPLTNLYVVDGSTRSSHRCVCVCVCACEDGGECIIVNVCVWMCMIVCVMDMFDTFDM